MPALTADEEGGGVGRGVARNANTRGQTQSAAHVALTALVGAIERRMRGRDIGPPPDAFLIGAYRSTLITALQQGLLDYVAVVHWPTFRRLVPVLSTTGLDGVRTAVALADTRISVMRDEILATLDQPAARPRSVLWSRLTRPTCGHIVFRSQFLALVEGEFGITSLEMAGKLARHTPSALRAMLQGRLIKDRPDLDGGLRQSLVWHTTRHVDRLLSDADALRRTLSLLRLAYYRLHHPLIARPVLRRVRVVDFTAARVAVIDDQARPRR